MSIAITRILRKFYAIVEIRLRNTISVYRRYSPGIEPNSHDQSATYVDFEPLEFARNQANSSECFQWAATVYRAAR